MNITFCINTSKNERYHIELLLKSIQTNFSRIDHPIIIYVENDNQNTVSFLKTQKNIFPNLKVFINPLPIPIGYARNINWMFETATTDIVSYLQSDMVVCKNYDVEVLKHINENTILSSTRIEPPLHPASSEKITHDFGLNPNTFDLTLFSNFAEEKKQNKITNFWFAPFTLYKKTWLDIGGHDTLFRRSREDSDLLYRFSMKGIQTKQIWNAIVYHFTCTSSRGIEWWTEKAKQRTQLQQTADQIELSKFLYKWPSFKHTSTFDSNKEYKYNVSLNLYNPMDNDFSILQNYYRFYKIYVSNPNTRTFLKKEFEKLHDPANNLLDISNEQWNFYKKYYRTLNVEDIFVDAPILDEDVILTCDLNNQPFNNLSNNPYLNTINDLIHSLTDNDIGSYELEELKSTIKINKISNKITENLMVKNPPLDFTMIEL